MAEAAGMSDPPSGAVAAAQAAVAAAGRERAAAAEAAAGKSKPKYRWKPRGGDAEAAGAAGMSEPPTGAVTATAPRVSGAGIAGTRTGDTSEDEDMVDATEADGFAANPIPVPMSARAGAGAEVLADLRLGPSAGRHNVGYSGGHGGGYENVRPANEFGASKRGRDSTEGDGNYHGRVDLHDAHALHVIQRGFLFNLVCGVKIRP